jgi:hypothetical protein
MLFNWVLNVIKPHTSILVQEVVVYYNINM